MPDRTISSNEYRYGFNGKENDSNGEWGDQLIQDYGFRLYNPAIGKFLSVDPLTAEFAWYTPYQYAGNKPIKFIDLDGLEIFDPAAKAPTGVAHFENAILPPRYQPDRSWGVNVGRYTLHYVKSETGEYWLATQYSNGGDVWEDKFIIGKDALIEFYQNVKKYEFMDDQLGMAHILSGGAEGYWEGWKMVVTNPVNWVVGAHLSVAAVEMNAANLAANNASRNIARGKTSKGSATTVASAEEVAIWEEFLTGSKNVTVYHKGELIGGVKAKTFSTGTNKKSVSALDRDGVVHQFDIPKNIYDDWVKQDLVKDLTDLDAATGVYNSEIRFDASIAKELNKYKKSE